MSAAEHARIRNAERQLASANKAEVRALAKSWGVPQKVAGDNRSVPDMRRDIKEKIKEAARRAGIAPALAELGAMALGEPVAGIAPALAEPGASVASSGHERGQKRERLQSGEERPEEKRDEDRPSGLEDLARIEVRKAIAELGEMPAGG